MKYLSLDKMKALDTKRLLAYKKKVLVNPIHPACRKADFRCSSGCDKCEFDIEADEYEVAYENCKQVLAMRENVK